MPADDKTLTIVQEWVARAENDFKSAAHLLKMKNYCPTDTVCFHAQQCIEKYLKVLLVMQGTDFPKTHDLERLLALIPRPKRPELANEEQDRLTDYATITRYPGDYEPISLAEARRAVRIARRVRTEIRKTLPKKAFRRRRY